LPIGVRAVDTMSASFMSWVPGSESANVTL
jgi:hypothetical protein